MTVPSRTELKEKATRTLAWCDEVGRYLPVVGGNLPIDDIRALAEAAMRRDGPAPGRSVVEGLASPGCCGLDEPQDEVLIVPATVL